MVQARPRLLLLAGAWSGERKAPVRAGGEVGWHLPPHVREPSEARRRLAEQVRAGADAIVAPTYWTSRPSLARFGEARRAREFTDAAVRLAREAAEEAGREVIVCGSLMPVAEDFESHAGMLAEAGADVLLVELMGSVAEARTATLAAAATGLPVWSGAQLETGEWLGEWAEAVELAAPEYLLTYAPGQLAREQLAELARLTARPLGVCLTAPADSESATSLLEGGAAVLGVAEGATTDALKLLREALDAQLEMERRAAEEARAAWQAWLERAAGWAPGGAALWLGPPPDDPLPAGFAWTVAPAEHAGGLPEGRFRLVVVGPSDGSAKLRSRLSRLLEEGGVLLGPPGAAEEDSGRVLDRSEDPPLVILRRD